MRISSSGSLHRCSRCRSQRASPNRCSPAHRTYGFGWNAESTSSLLNLGPSVSEKRSVCMVCPAVSPCLRRVRRVCSSVWFLPLGKSSVTSVVGTAADPKALIDSLSPSG
jgi:hypothetical protein